MAYKIIPLLLCQLYLQATYLNGYYEIEYATYKESDFKWNLSLPRHYLQLKLFSQPFRGTSLYGQLSLKTDEWDEKKRSILLFERGIATLTRKHFQLLILTKEERHWIKSPSLQLIDPYITSNYLNSNSLRLNLSFKQLNLSILDIYHLPIKKTEWYGSYFDINSRSSILNLRYTPFSLNATSLELGANFLANSSTIDKFSLINDSYKYTDSLILKHTIHNFYLELFHKGALFIIEHARNLEKEHNNSAISLELKGAKLYNLILSFKLYNYQRNFYCPFNYDFSEGAMFDRKGLYFEVSYLMPKKMVTLTAKLNHYSSSYEYQRISQEWKNLTKFYFLPHPYTVTYIYSDIYIEFINNLKLRLAGECLAKDNETYPATLAETYIEAKNLFTRLQLRLKDIGVKKEVGEKIIYALEFRITPMKNIQLYYREVIVEGRNIRKYWESSFWQLRYFIGWDVDLYLEYGNGWDTGQMAYSPMIDNPSTSTSHLIKIFLRTNF